MRYRITAAALTLGVLAGAGLSTTGTLAAKGGNDHQPSRIIAKADNGKSPGRIIAGPPIRGVIETRIIA